MSVINTMLQDLDKRNGRPGGEAATGDAVRSVKPESPWQLGRNALLLIVAVVGAALLAGVWWLQQRGALATSGNRSLATAPPTVATSLPVASMPAAASAPVAAVAASAVPVPTPQVEPSALMAVAPVPASASAAAAPVVTAMTKAVAPVAPLPSFTSRVSNPTEKVEAFAPPQAQPKAGALNPKAVGGKTYSPVQVTANLMAEAVVLERQGRTDEAKALLQRVLLTNSLDSAARQMLVELQLDTGQIEAARALLAEGQRLHPEQSHFSVALARLRVEIGDVNGAIQILESGRTIAGDDPQYRAFLAALLLRTGRHDEAVQHYLVALRSEPANGSWLIGVGVAFEGVGKHADAAEAYRRADSAPNLTPELANFLNERLTRIRR